MPKWTFSLICKLWNKKNKTAMYPCIPFKKNSRNKLIPDINRQQLAYITATLSCCYCCKLSSNTEKKRIDPQFWYCYFCGQAMCIDCLSVLYNKSKNQLFNVSDETRTEDRRCITCELKQCSKNVCVFEYLF